MDALFSVGRKIPIGDQVYEVLSSPPASGMTGQVYKATDGLRDYAIKVFLPLFRLRERGYVRPGSAIHELIELQRTEHEFLCKMSHPNIVRVYT
jgi:serine/threonine protein kinase